MNPNAIHILEKNLHKVNWNFLIFNKNLIDLFPLDYEAMREKNRGFLSDLLRKEPRVPFEPPILQKIL